MADRVRYTTILDRLEISMGLGIYPQERAAPQRVLVSVWLAVDYIAPIIDDRIEQVLDYDFVRTGIRSLVADRHFDLQESFCDAVAALCLADARVAEVRVRSMKSDIYPDAAVGCEIIRYQTQPSRT